AGRGPDKQGADRSGAVAVGAVSVRMMMGCSVASDSPCCCSAGMGRSWVVGGSLHLTGSVPTDTSKISRLIRPAPTGLHGVLIEAKYPREPLTRREMAHS